MDYKGLLLPTTQTKLEALNLEPADLHLKL